MVKAQEWLDANYPKEKRGEVKELYLNESSLIGVIDLEKFTYNDFTYRHGVKVYISVCVDETKLDIKNQPEKAEIIKLVNAQK